MLEVLPKQSDPAARALDTRWYDSRKRAKTLYGILDRMRHKKAQPLRIEYFAGHKKVKSKIPVPEKYLGHGNYMALWFDPSAKDAQTAGMVIQA